MLKLWYTCECTHTALCLYNSLEDMLRAAKADSLCSKCGKTMKALPPRHEGPKFLS